MSVTSGYDTMMPDSTDSNIETLPTISYIVVIEFLMSLQQTVLL